MLTKLKIHPASHPDFHNFEHNYDALKHIDVDSKYENYLFLNTPFHLPNSTADVFSQISYFKDGGYLKIIDPYLNDIRNGITKLLFFFVDWWGFCNIDEVSEHINANLVSYDIYEWVYQHMKKLNLLEHSAFSSPVSTQKTSIYEDWPIIHFNEAFLRYIDFGTQIDTSSPDGFDNFLFYLNRRPRAHRLYTLHELNRTGLLNDCQYTFHFFDESLNAGLTSRESYLCSFLNGWIEPDKINTDIVNLSRENFEHDTVYNSTTDDQTLPELVTLNAVSRNCYLELVTEYNCSNTKVFLTEKIARSIVLKNPFVVVGDCGSLAELKHYGFRTFDSIWDESYDQLPTARERADAVIELLQYIKNNFDWHSPYSKEIQEVLDYNRQHYFNLFFQQQQQEFKKVFS